MTSVSQMSFQIRAAPLEPVASLLWDDCLIGLLRLGPDLHPISLDLQFVRIGVHSWSSSFRVFRRFRGFSVPPLLPCTALYLLRKKASGSPAHSTFPTQ